MSTSPLRPRIAIALLVLLFSVCCTPSAAGAAPSAPLAAPAPDPPWSWPVAGQRKILEPFRAPAHEYGPGHRGMDIAAEVGAVVSAPTSGVVAYRGAVVDRPLLTIDTGAGWVITVEPVASTLDPGDVLSAGDQVGVVSAGGHAPRSSLHVGVRWYGEYINPMPLFGEVPRAVLLPCCRAL